MLGHNCNKPKELNPRHQDKLTGLKNRRYLQEKLEEQIAGYSLNPEPFSLCIIDIDHCKKVNDTFGHQTGDYVLEKLASILKSQSRKEDIVARYGGEEFVVLLPNTGISEARTIAENLRHSIADSTWNIGQITVSIGIATFTSADTDSILLQKADRALYTSKEQGRNRVTHSIDMNE